MYKGIGALSCMNFPCLPGGAKLSQYTPTGDGDKLVEMLSIPFDKMSVCVKIGGIRVHWV